MCTSNMREKTGNLMSVRLPQLPRWPPGLLLPEREGEGERERRDREIWGGED